ncbi:uncharacterized protein K444DRAFT_647793 [Hyaloscypha bicolor E]|uniref:Uncharacterized protein n=1 Tax=Hyaloscypha bicolor E TaxID=1095630 RepID=A0A2J6SM53_9HELO|nr:uncharacterized protein K444DRAFT_647793 [Hyaloscypha bicolor E]PMD51800.1 hypothetical protein K444DRAFT_647793 [Hyaloscypha bicolor E]
MRYQNWDVLLFPDLSKIPFQEFKTSCSVVQDPECHTLQTNPLLLPTVTSFVVGLSAGAAFRVSIHCWENPEISRYIQNLKKPSDNIVFEARLFIDGRIAGSKWFNQTGPWPTVIELSIDLDKHGEFEKLKFPTFHKELLSQSYWNPGDDLGRIKVIIAEGFTRDHLPYPFERVKNIVSFSFQHAPLDVLEASSIAWPNASMWRHVSLGGPYFAQAASPRSEPVEHGHSPRHVGTMTTTRATLPAPPKIGSMLPPAVPAFPRQPSYDPFTESVHVAFRGWRQASSDTSMPDFSDPSTRSNSRNVSDPMQISQTLDRRFEPNPVFDELCEVMMPSAPVNTLQNEAVAPKCITVKSEPESKHENVQEPLVQSELVINDNAVRIVSNPFSSTTNSGTKRQRIITPAAAKVIDDADEPRTSPSFRKTSLGTTKQESDENDRKILGPIENV